MTGKSCLRAGALGLLALCFFASALLRAGDVVAALSLPGGAAANDTAANDTAANDTAGGLSQADPAAGAEVVTLAAELGRQRAALARREAALTEREQLLEGIEVRLEKRLAELEAAREALARTAALVDRAAEKDVARLAEIYRRMKPKEAARIFDSMAPEFAAGFLTEMGPDGAAPILAGMAPDKAYAVSLLIAGRNLERP